MEYRDDGRVILIRLHQGEDLIDSLKEIARKCDLKTGVIVSGIGMLKQAELAFFVAAGEYATVFFPEPRELVSLSGNIILQDGDYQMHMHAVLADEKKQTVAGHLSKGKVNVTNEIAILKASIEARRKLDDSTGLMALTFEGDR